MKMIMETNPFGTESRMSNVEGQSGNGSVLDVRRATRDDEPSLETRRSELKPHVRKYANKLYAEIQAFYATYGAEDAADLYARAKAGKVIVPKEEAKKLLRLQTELETALTNNEAPHRELPPLEFFQKLVKEINLNHAPYQVSILFKWDEYELINGKLNGRISVTDIDDTQLVLPIIDGALLERIGNKLIQDCKEVRNIGGNLNGCVWVDDVWLPVIDGELIEQIEGQRIEGCSDIRNVDGKLNGIVTIGGYDTPVINGKIVNECEGMAIRDCTDIRNVDGKLNGVLDVGWKAPVMDGKLVDTVDGHQFTDGAGIRNIDGKLNGAIRVDGKWLPVIDGKLIYRVGKQEFQGCDGVRNIDGKLNCRLNINGRMVHVVAGVPIFTIDGLLVGDSDLWVTDGKMNGKFQEGRAFSRWLPVMDGKIVWAIAGNEIVTTYEFTDAGGVMNGRFKIKDANGNESVCRVILGEIVR